MPVYGLDFQRFHEHLIEITLEATIQPDQQLWLPVWIPGSYLVREFSRHIEAVQAQVDGQSVPVRKLSKNRWQVCHPVGGALRLSYRVYAFDLSVRGSYVDQQRIYVNPATCCLVVAGQESQPHQMRVQRPVGFEQATLVCALPVQRDGQVASWQADSHAQLIDHPFELAEVQSLQFEAAGLAHRLTLSGLHQAHLPRLQADLQRLCETQLRFFGQAPFADYLFMVMATGNLYGGLEHQSCTSLITPRDDLPGVLEPAQPSAGYQRFLGLCSHEYFHAWLVKCIRPEPMLQPDLEREVYLPLLWVFEGLTSYYDDLMLYRAGLISRQAYLRLLEEQITRHWQTPGHRVQSLAESGLDAWIKYYRPDENSPNATTSYYNHGALAGLSLDLLLRRHGQSLDALMHWLYAEARQGRMVSQDRLLTRLTGWAGAAAETFWRDQVEGCQPLPLEDQLQQFGVRLKTEHKGGTLGLKLSEAHGIITVQQVLRDSPAARAGVSAHDQIIAVDGVRATQTLLQKLNQAATRPVCLQVFRRDELLALSLQPQEVRLPVARLEVTDEAALAGWLADGAGRTAP